MAALTIGHILIEVIQPDRRIPAVGERTRPAQFVADLLLLREAWNREEREIRAVNICSGISVNITRTENIGQRAVADFRNVQFKDGLVPTDIRETDLVRTRREVRQVTISLLRQIRPDRAVAFCRSVFVD